MIIKRLTKVVKAIHYHSQYSSSAPYCLDNLNSLLTLRAVRPLKGCVVTIIIITNMVNLSVANFVQLSRRLPFGGRNLHAFINKRPKK